MITRKWGVAPLLIAAAILLCIAVPAAAQIPTATIKIQGAPLGQVWPNGGALPILAYGWGGNRPKPIDQLTDSLEQFWRGDSLPVLIVQRRDDIFTPLIERVISENVTLAIVHIAINALGNSPLVYRLENVRIVASRDVGAVFGDEPTTREIVLTFDAIIRES